MTTASLAPTPLRPVPSTPSRAARPIAITDRDEEELRLALEAYRKSSGRLFPTWSEILEILVELGYAKRIWKPVAVEETR